MPFATTAHNSKVRHPQLAARLEQAADLHPHCPAKEYGRLRWVAEEMAKKNVVVSQETVRKWFAGENAPTHHKGLILAHILDADTSWLMFGGPGMTQHDRKLRNAMADGAVNVVAGLIQMDGGYPAFPEEHDKTAQRNNVHLHAIIRGAKYDFHVALGQTKGRRAVFEVSTQQQGNIVLGVIRDGFSFDVFELTPEIIEAHGKRANGSIEVSVDGAALKRIESFSERI